MAEQSLRDFEVKELAYENAVAARYDNDYHEAPVMRWHDQNFMTFLKKQYHPGDRILDLGCGPASLWKLFKDEFPDAGELVGVDFSPGMIEEARSKWAGDELHVGSMFEIPLDSGRFDIVVVSSAFHHIPDADLPIALREISRVMDEHGVLVGREPLCTRRLGDRGGWLAGALMNLRHLAYRLTHTREYPEPDPGPAHHAYDAEAFLAIIGSVLTVTDVGFRHPVSHFLARVRDRRVAAVARFLDNSINHREGQELFYAAAKNYATAETVKECVRKALLENKVDDVPAFLALVEASARLLERELKRPQR